MARASWQAVKLKETKEQGGKRRLRFVIWVLQNLPLKVFLATPDFEEESFREEASSFLSTQQIDIVFYTLDQTLGQPYGVKSCREMFAGYPRFIILTKTDLVDERTTSKLVQQITEEGETDVMAVILNLDARKRFTICPECASELGGESQEQLIMCEQCEWRGSTLPSQEEFGVSEVICRVERMLKRPIRCSCA